MIPEDLRPKRLENSSIKRSEWNAVQAFLTKYRTMSRGFVEGETAGGEYDFSGAIPSDVFPVITYDQIPPYSVFAGKYLSNIPENHFSPFLLEVSQWVHGSRRPLLTNAESDGRFDYTYAEAGASLARVIGWDRPTLLRRYRGDNEHEIKVGYNCGPEFGTYEVNGGRTGFKCVGLDENNDLVLVLANQPGQTFIGKPDPDATEPKIAPNTRGTFVIWGGSTGDESSYGERLYDVQNRGFLTLYPHNYCVIFDLDGELYAMPFPRGALTRLVKTTVDHASGDFHPVKVQTGNPPSLVDAPSGWELEAYNLTSVEIPADTLCLALEIDTSDEEEQPNLAWYIEPWVC